MAQASVSSLVGFLQEKELLTRAHVQQLSANGQPLELRAFLREAARREWLTTYQVNRIASGHAEELIVGAYRVLEPIGEGGMGKVFKARHVRMDRIVALKIIPEECLANPTAVSRFYREIRAVAQLSHPNIVTAYEANQEGRTHYLAMEYLDGIDLAKLVKQSGPLPVSQACEFIRQAALGLQHAHEKGLVHRDIKPGNIMAVRCSHDAAPVIKVLDFGLARLDTTNQPGTRLTKVGSVIGTVDYISPEQAGDATVDIRSDIFSLGCSLFYLLTGTAPFPGRDAVERMLARVVNDAPALRTVRKDAPAGLEKVLAKMLARNPGERFQTPGEVAAALKPFASDTGVVAPNPATATQVLLSAKATVLPSEKTETICEAAAGPGPRRAEQVKAAAPEDFKDLISRRPSPSRRKGSKGALLVAGIGVAVLVLLIGLWVGGVLRPRHTGKNSERGGPSSTNNVDKKRGGPKGGDKDGGAPAVPLPGSTNAGDYDLTGGRRFVHFGPDGPHVVLAVNDVKRKEYFARVYNLSTGRALSPPLIHSAFVAFAYFCPDGTRVVTGSGDLKAGAGRVWDAATGRPLTPPLEHDCALYHASFSPDSRRVVTASGKGTARVWDAQTGQPLTPLLTHELGKVVNRAMFSPDGKRVVTAGANGARVWDAQTGQPVTPPLMHDQAFVWHASFSPDGKRVVTAAWDGTARLWDAHTGQLIPPLLIHDQASVWHASFSPDGKRVVTASGARWVKGAPASGDNNMARVWDAQTGQTISPPLSHDKNVVHASFSPDGARVVTASADNTARVWDAVTGQPLTPPLKHDESVWHASFSPDGKCVVTVSADRTARLWEAETGIELKSVSASAPQELPDGGALPAPGSIYGRSASPRAKLRDGDATVASEAAVERGLKWLVRKQSQHGVWGLGGDTPVQDSGVAGTAFGLLPFLGAGMTHKASKDNPHDQTVDRGLRFLINGQDPKDGHFAMQMHAHALATMALAEAYGLSLDPALRGPAQRAVNYIVSAQHSAGGWRYTSGLAGDTDVSGWQITALKTAQMVGLNVPDRTLTKAQQFLDSVCAPDEGYGYTAPTSPTPSLTAVGLLCRQYLQGWGPDNSRLRNGIEHYLRPNLPATLKNMYYHYYATQVFHHVGGKDWKNWNMAMRDHLIDTQDTTTGENYGSWSPEGDAHGQTGGRLMVTSLSIMTLEASYRHVPLHQNH